MRKYRALNYFNYFAYFAFGGLSYACLELLWRGRTHWTMMLLGGICTAVLYAINIHCRQLSIFKRALMGCAFITISELLTGIAVNIVLSWNVWDYSRVPFNFLGQICLLYCAVWFALCLAVLSAMEASEKIAARNRKRYNL